MRSFHPPVLYQHHTTPILPALPVSTMAFVNALNTDSKITKGDEFLGNLGTTGSAYGHASDYNQLPTVGPGKKQVARGGFTTTKAPAVASAESAAPAAPAAAAAPYNPNACKRCGKTVYAAENPVSIGGMKFHLACFTCATTGTKLTRRTATVSKDANGQNDVYMSNSEAKSSLGAYSHGKEPEIKPDQVVDVITARVAVVPDANMRTTDRKFNVAGKAVERGCIDADQGSAYGEGSVGVVTQTSVDRPPTTVNNINLHEKRWNGAENNKYRGRGKADSGHKADLEPDTGSSYGN
jgi:hypothetical protein